MWQVVVQACLTIENGSSRWGSFGNSVFSIWYSVVSDDLSVKSGFLSTLLGLIAWCNGIEVSQFYRENGEESGIHGEAFAGWQLDEGMVFLIMAKQYKYYYERYQGMCLWGSRERSSVDAASHDIHRAENSTHVLGRHFGTSSKPAFYCQKHCNTSQNRLRFFLWRTKRQTEQ